MVPYLQHLCLFVCASFLTSDMIMSCVTPLAKVVLIPALPSFLSDGTLSPFCDGFSFLLQMRVSSMPLDQTTMAAWGWTRFLARKC